MSKPEIKIAFKNDDIKVLGIVGKLADHIPSHKVNTQGILQVLSGHVSYIEADRRKELKENDYQLIPPEVVHELVFNTDARVNLILPVKSKLQFSK